MNDVFAKLSAHPRIADLSARFARSPLTRRFIHGAGWSMLGNVVWKLFAAVANIILARILGPQGVGELGIVRSTAATFEVFAGLRLGATATRYVAEYRTSDPPRAARILKLALVATVVLCGLAALVMAIAAPWLATDVLGHPGLSGLLVLGAVMIFVNVYGRVQELALAGLERFRAIAGVNAWRGVGNLLICVPLAYLYGVAGAVIGLILVAALTMLRYGLLLRRETVKAGFPTAVPLRQLRQELPVLWSFAVPGLLAAVMQSASAWAARAILARQDGGFAQLGLFEAAQYLRFPIAFLPSVLAPVILPLLARAHGEGASGDFKSLMGLQLRTVTFVTLPISILLIGFAQPLALLFGEAFAGLPPVIALAAVSAFVYAINTSITRAFDGVGRRWVNTLFFAVWGATFVIAGHFWIPERGAIGMAAANLLAEFVMIGLQVVYVDLVLIPGVLRDHGLLMLFALLLLAGSLLAFFVLPTPVTIAVAVGLSLVATLPVIAVARRRLQSGARR
jgi:O-antigen/teichoic acid export membrane protein